MNSISSRYKAVRKEHQDAIMDEYEDDKVVAVKALATSETPVDDQESDEDDDINDEDEYEEDDVEEVEVIVPVKKLVKKKKVEPPRFIVKKDKKSQALNSVTNSFAFMDTGNDVNYSVSITITTFKKDSTGPLAPKNLEKLQTVVSEFVSDIHTKL